ncbi:MAG: hypothetical protein JSU86_12100 [Phycisphaerales bacterium]|nr:MAG: hypothetical protein JSU86_12100 [Phycisphaerales bacterium]
MSTVIKARESVRIVGRLSTVDLADYLAEARAVVEESRRRASQITADARVQADRVLADAKESGYQSGYAQGHAEGTQAGHKAAYDESVKQFGQSQADVVAAMEQATTEINAIKEDLRIAAEKDLLDFALLIAKKLTFAIGRLHPESAIENLERALRLVECKTNLTIRVHPDDKTSMQTFAESVLEQAEASPVVDIVSDESLAPGGCKVESPRTRVDASLETQIDEIVSLLLGGRASDG